LALAVSLEELGIKENLPKAQLLGKALDAATEKLLENNKSPSRKTGELDNRGSHFFLGMYWAQELAAQDEDAELKARFEPLAKALTDNQDTILKEMSDAQGHPVDIGGYYHPDTAKTSAVMCPSKTLNKILSDFRAA
jgi:isocitrate dehydrogenase